jgi:excisionase family DNA binding protein
MAVPVLQLGPDREGCTRAGATSCTDACLVVDSDRVTRVGRLHHSNSLMPIDPLLLPIPRLLEVAHVAHRLGASQEYVRRLIRRRELAAIRLGARWRVEPADLQAFVDAQRVPSNGHQSSERPRAMQPAADNA